MERLEKLIKEFKSHNHSIRYHYVGLMKEELQKCCDRFSDVIDDTKKVTYLKYLCFRCDYLIKEISEVCDYKFEYKPSEKDLEAALKKGIVLKEVSQDDWTIYDKTGKLTISIIESLKRAYNDEHKEVSTWCNDIRFLKDCMLEMIERTTDKIAFENEVAKWENTKVLTIDDYLICDDKDKVKEKIKPLLKGKQNMDVAYVIFALQEMKYMKGDINVSALDKILMQEFETKESRKRLGDTLKELREYKSDKDKGTPNEVGEMKYMNVLYIMDKLK